MIRGHVLADCNNLQSSLPTCAALHSEQNLTTGPDSFKKSMVSLL